MIEQPQLAHDPRFADNASRVENRTAMLSAVSAGLAGRTTDECIAWLAQEGIVVGAVRNYGQVVQAEDVMRSGILGTDGDGNHYVAAPYRLSGERPVGPRVPAAGQHTREILTKLAKLSDETATQLIADGVARESPG